MSSDAAQIFVEALVYGLMVGVIAWAIREVVDLFGGR